MKAFVRKIVSVYFLYIHKTVVMLMNYLSFFCKERGMCLVFHHIVTSEEQNDLCICTKSNFESILLYYLKEGYSFVDIPTAIRMASDMKMSNFITITFDDVPDDIIENAIPFLNKHAIPYTLFVSMAYVGQDGYLTESQIKVLSKSPLCTIGSHSMTHNNLRFSKTIQYEIQESKMQLQKMIDKPVEYFAYPYGSIYAINSKSIKLVKGMYKAGFTTINAPMNHISLRNRFLIPRIAVNKL